MKRTVNITEKAAAHLSALLTQQEKQYLGLRIAVVDGGCAGLRYHLGFEDEERDGDEVIESNGIKLFVDKISGKHLKGAVLDYEESLEGSYFKVDNPNARSTCGCGKSFRPYSTD